MWQLQGKYCWAWLQAVSQICPNCNPTPDILSVPRSARLKNKNSFNQKNPDPSTWRRKAFSCVEPSWPSLLFGGHYFVCRRLNRFSIENSALTVNSQGDLCTKLALRWHCIAWFVILLLFSLSCLAALLPHHQLHPDWVLTVGVEEVMDSREAKASNWIRLVPLGPFLVWYRYSPKMSI